MEYIDLIQTIALVATVIGITAEFRRFRLAIRSDTTQRIISMMNDLRIKRLEDPQLDRTLFSEREKWSDDETKRHVCIVSLVNIFEWSYMARRDGLIDKKTWNQWVKTWRDIIVKDPKMRNAFGPTVYTFSHKDTRKAIEQMIKGDQETIPDPHP